MLNPIQKLTPYSVEGDVIFFLYQGGRYLYIGRLHNRMSSNTVIHILYRHCLHIMFSYIIVGTCLLSYTRKSVITRTCVYSDRLAGALYIDDYDGEQCRCSDSYTKYRAPATG